MSEYICKWRRPSEGKASQIYSFHPIYLAFDLQIKINIRKKERSTCLNIIINS